MRVLLFAALRDAAAGAREVDATGATVPALLDDLRERFGEPFSSRLAISTVVVDGDPVDPSAPTPLTGAEEIALLPPFSGGA